MGMVLGCTLALVGIASGADFELREDFGKLRDGALPAKAWKTTGFSWEVHKGRLVCEDAGKSFAMPRSAPHGRNVTVEATLTAEKPLGREWKVAGVAIYRDGGNYWHLAMAEGPAAEGKAPRRHWELLESLRGRWLANVQGATALPAWGKSVDGAWKYGVAYRVRLEMTGEGVRGKVTDPAGAVVWQSGWRFAKGKQAVRAGRPALDCGDLRAAFDDVRFVVDDVTGPPASERPAKFPAYDRPAMSDVRSKATGFFRAEKIDGTWWLIDPKGCAFYGIGTDHARYTGHGCEKLGYAPYGRNMARKFPDEADWCVETAGRLKRWGFNTIAAGHSRSLRHRGLVHTEFISFGARFSSYSDITPKVHWTGFPNVFHPRWEAYCRKVAEEFCRRQAGDPWLLGYFLDNELEWYGKSHRPFGLVEEAWAKPPDHAAKQALVELLKQRNGTIEKLNAAWGTEFASFDALAKSTTMPQVDTPGADADRYAYLERIADRYFGACRRAIRSVDANHMILGSRFAGGVHDCVWRAAGRHLDVVTVNQYERVDLETHTAARARELLQRYHQLCGRPMVLTEWSFPALDSGLPCTKGAGQRFDTQAQRTEAFGVYQKMLFSLPFMVGSHFFMWVDEPALGISSTFPENTNYGLVDEKGEPYAELTARAARLNPQAVRFHSRNTAEIAVRIDAKRKLAVLANAGKLAADVPVEVWEDGRRRGASVRVPAGGSGTVRLRTDARREAHFVAVRADPDRTLPEADRRDNFAAGHVMGHGSTANKAVTMIAVANPTPRPLRDVVVRLPVGPLLGAGGGKGALITAIGAEGARPPMQLNASAAGPEVAFRVESVPPFGSVNYHVTPLVRAEAVEAEALQPPFEISNGRLRLRKRDDDGDLIDDVVLDGVSLGRVQALVHENVGQDLWLPANRLVSVRRLAGPVETTLEFVAAYQPARKAEVKTVVDDAGKFAAARRTGGAYRARYRLRIADRRQAFQLRCVSVTNADTRPWRLEAYFHYLPSHVGGSAAGDDVSAAGVPNYYGLRTVWYDAKVGAGYGAVVPAPLEANFWLNPAGGQHPDVRRKIARTLKPGETWTVPDDEPAVWVFGVRGPAEKRPWRAIAQDLKARAEVSVKVWR